MTKLSERRNSSISDLRGNQTGVESVDFICLCVIQKSPIRNNWNTKNKSYEETRGELLNNSTTEVIECVNKPNKIYFS